MAQEKRKQPEPSTVDEEHDGFKLDAGATPVGPKPTKAYKSESFLASHDARMIRVMCELMEPKARLNEHGVQNVVMFFGSARAKSRPAYEEALQKAEKQAADHPSDEKFESDLKRLRKQQFLVPMYEATTELAKQFTEWSRARVLEGKAAYSVGTGGGPGMMEAANKGAWLAKGPSCGFGISLPFEDRLNPYVTPELGFEFHYFFTRKWWMSYKCMGLVVAPGGLGTCDELFEIMTLMQTGKIKRKLPVVLIGKQFWKSCINWESFVEFGMISAEDASQLHFVDTVEEAMQALVGGIERMEEVGFCGSPLLVGARAPGKF